MNENINLATLIPTLNHGTIEYGTPNLAEKLNLENLQHEINNKTLTKTPLAKTVLPTTNTPNSQEHSETGTTPPAAPEDSSLTKQTPSSHEATTNSSTSAKYKTSASKSTSTNQASSWTNSMAPSASSTNTTTPGEYPPQAPSPQTKQFTPPTS